MGRKKQSNEQEVLEERQKFDGLEEVLKDGKKKTPNPTLKKQVQYVEKRNLCEYLTGR